MNFRPLAAAALALAAAALAVGLAPVATASASPPGDRAEHGAVFVETNDETSNAIIVYSRGRDGHLNETGRFPPEVSAEPSPVPSSPSTPPTSVSGRSSPSADTCRSPWASHVTWCTS